VQYETLASFLSNAPAALAEEQGAPLREFRLAGDLARQALAPLSTRGIKRARTRRRPHDPAGQAEAVIDGVNAILAQARETIR
jgi:hypothetical protein